VSRLAPLPSPDDWTAEEDRLGFFGPDSVTWRIHADPSYHLGGMRALMMQALHPVAMDGVATCVLSEINGAVTGTANVETGESASTANLISHVFLGLTSSPPITQPAQHRRHRRGVR